MSKKAKAHRKKIAIRNARLAQQRAAQPQPVKSPLDYVAENYSFLIQQAHRPEVFQLLQECGPQFRQS